MSQAQDVMSRKIVAVSADATVEDAIRSLLEHHVSGAPIVDEQGCLVGIISEFQLLEAVYTPEIKQQRVSDLMTKDVVTVTEDASLSEITNMLLLHRIRRVPVVRDRKVVGIIARRDLLRYVVDTENPQGQPPDQLKAVADVP